MAVLLLCQFFNFLPENLYAALHLLDFVGWYWQVFLGLQSVFIHLFQFLAKLLLFCLELFYHIFRGFGEGPIDLF